MIVSFAHTTDALLSGLKTVTRRDWCDSHAAKFGTGQLVDAYDHLPRSGGHKVATIRLTCDPYKERLIDMPDSDLAAEGGLWRTKEDFIDCFGGDHKRKVWVVRFVLVKGTGQMTLPFAKKDD